jgi:hypothetical protein
MVTPLQPDVAGLAYDNLFDRYKTAVAALGQASAQDAMHRAGDHCAAQ